MTDKNKNLNEIETERPRYFGGQTFSSDDFKLQERYQSDRQRYYNRSLHVSGIIEGLEASVKQNKIIEIEPGRAIDSKGRLIVLNGVESVTIELKQDYIGCFFYIQYYVQSAYPDPSGNPETNSRWHEQPIFGFPNTNGEISEELGIKLGKLQKNEESGEYEIETTVREYSGISLPNPTNKALTLRGVGQSNTPIAVLSGSLQINGDLTVDGTISGKIGADKITSGELVVERIPNLSADKITSGELAIQRIPDLSADKITSGELVVERIPNLSADKITSGELAIQRIPDLSANKITSGELAVERIPNLSADKITSGVFATKDEPCLKVIQGQIESDGSILSGTGFTCHHTGEGLYEIKFKEKFKGYPAVIATQESHVSGASTLDNVIVTTSNSSNCTFKCGDDKGHAKDRRFSFICIGQTE